MRSPAWKRKSNQVLKRDNYICQACLKEPATMAHHKTYVNFGQEPLFDLEAVGPRCHQKLTALARRRVKCETLDQQLEQMLLQEKF